LNIRVNIGDWGLGIGNPQSPIPNPQGRSFTEKQNELFINF